MANQKGSSGQLEGVPPDADTGGRVKDDATIESGGSGPLELDLSRTDGPDSPESPAPVRAGAEAKIPGAADDLELVGSVLRTVYHDESTRYTVLRVQLQGRLEASTAVGRTRALEEGARVRMWGQWDEHPTHGAQFAFARLLPERPKTPEAIARRLTRYPGVKEVLAERIVARFGTDTLTILDKQPDRFMEVEGIGRKTYERLIAYHRSREGPLVELENRLIELELSTRFADPLHRRYGEQALEMLEHHPYRLAREVRGVGFSTADRLARALGVDPGSPERIDAGVLYAVERAELDGHCALPRPQLIEQARRLLDRPVHEIEAGVERMLEEGDLVLERVSARDPEAPDAAELCFLRHHLLAEQAVSQSLTELAVLEHPRWPVGTLPDHLSAGQVEAVRSIAEHGVVLLTGGPGTGKSTVVRQVIELALQNGADLHLAAPTGRAAKRLEQATGQPAKTIHRLLEVQGDSGAFYYHANNPLPEGLVVVDEASMLDLPLAEALLTALTPSHRLMLVGDADQLPSVGPGNVLADLLEACTSLEGVVPVVRLEEVFRQAEGSSIVRNAHRILRGEELVSDPSGQAGEFFVVRASDPARVRDLVLTLASERIPDVYGFDSIDEVQVLSPMHRGEAGTEVFNRELQHLYSSEAEQLRLPQSGSMPARSFRVGDRVMQTRNDYQRSVFNGDIGTVVSVNQEERSLVCAIDGVEVAYTQRELAALRLAYAISIHKSQGSEFPAVIIPLMPEHHVMLRRNLIYTAVTRAKSLCILVGDPRALERAIRRADDRHRFTGLSARVQARLAEALA